MKAGPTVGCSPAEGLPSRLFVAPAVSATLQPWLVPQPDTPKIKLFEGMLRARLFVAALFGQARTRSALACDCGPKESGLARDAAFVGCRL